MLSQREIEILSYLSQRRNEFVKSSEIATMLQLSDRTIRKYVKTLKPEVEKNGATLIAKQGYGYQLKIDLMIEFENFLKRYLSKNGPEQENINDSKDRQYYILNLLLFNKVSITIEQLSEQLYISRSTVSQDIASIKNIIAQYNLGIVSKQQHGIAIEGDERDKRHFIMDYFLGNHFFHSINKYFQETPLLLQINMEELVIIVVDETRESKVYLSDYILQNLVLHLGLMIRRLLDGYSLKTITSNEEVLTENELSVARKILNRVERIYKISFPEEEAKYISLHIMTKGSQLQNQDAQSDLSQRVSKILNKIEKDLGFPMSSDSQLLYGLVTHLEPLIKRIQNKFHLENPILHDIKAQNESSLTMTKTYFGELEELKNQEVSDGEWAYLTLHLLAAIEKYYQREKLNVLVICATGYGSAQMLKVRAEREFSLQMNIVDVISYYEITDEKLEHIDLIISSIDLSTIVFKVPVIQVNVLLNEQDIKKINTFIHHHDNKFSYNDALEENVATEQYSLFFNQYCNESSFNYIEEAITKEALFDLLIKQLSLKEEQDFEDKLRRQLNFREELSTVVFSDDVAVPHTAQPVGDYSSIAVALVPNGVYWDEQHQQIKLVIMLSPSKYNDNELKTIIDIIVNLIDSDEKIAEIMNCKDYNSFKNYMVGQYHK
ncbi:BglG family transcription antiterminator [Mammaliicoccus sp. G-M28]|uniref:BglG family transcription antiterminator n=1 Tax=Mammaliicoccus sp. G-M28 TaxID=2898688 RepID=UPI001EFB404A|nr:BglG family transcription antiterminator [Mammaliicoccus sp. G-M28]